MSFWAKLFGTTQPAPVAVGQAGASSTPDGRSIVCPACARANTVPRTRPPFGTAVICDHCKASLVRVADPNRRPYSPPREVALFLGYEACSLLHARCPHCRAVNYSVVVPENGHSVSFYWNRQQENANAAFVVNVSCPHCQQPFVIAWDDDPR